MTILRNILCKECKPIFCRHRKRIDWSNSAYHLLHQDDKPLFLKCFKQKKQEFLRMQVPQSISDIRLLSSKRNGASKRSDIRTYEFAEYLRPGTGDFHISRFDQPFK